MKAIRNKLAEVLAEMNLPTLRRELTPENLKWMAANLHALNNGHKDLPFATHLIHTLLVEVGNG
jgi:hypothetical protein